MDRVARQLLLAVGGPDGTPEPAAAAEPMDGWMLSWLAGTAGPLVGQAPQVAAQLLRQAVASSRPGPQHDHLAARLADALYRVVTLPGLSGWPGMPLLTLPNPSCWRTCTGRWSSA